MAGGRPWTEEEEDYLALCIAHDWPTQDITKSWESQFGYARGHETIKRARSARTRVKEQVEAWKQSGPRGMPPLSRPEAVARHLSGEYVPGIRERLTDWELPEDVDWREWFDSFQTTLDLHKRIDPHQEILTIDFSDSDQPFVFSMASDLHLGGGFTDHREIRNTIELILRSDLKLGLIGDVMEGFIPGEKSAETVEQMVASNKAQLAAMKSMVYELCDSEKLVCLAWGDHDAKWFEKLIGLNIVKASFHDRVPYFNGRGLIRLLVGGEEYFVQVNHRFMGNSMYNPNHPQRRAHGSLFPADVTVSGHLHKPAFQMLHHYEQLREAGVNIGGKTWLVQTGTWKTGPDPYTVRNWSKGIIGVPTAIFYPDRHDVDVVDAPDKALALVRGLRAA